MIDCDDELRRAHGRARPAALARASRRCTRPARSPRTSALETPGLDTLDMPRLLEGHADRRLDADDLRQRRAVEGLLPRAERVRRVAGRRHDSTTSPCPASTRPAWRCPGAARRTRCGSSATRAWPTSRSLGGLFDRALMQGVPQIVGATLEKIEGMSEEEKFKRRSPSGGRGQQRDAAAREPAHQHLAGLGPRHRAARARARACCAAPATTSRPACSRPTAPTTSSTARRAASASRRPARRSATASCSAVLQSLRPDRRAADHRRRRPGRRCSRVAAAIGSRQRRARVRRSSRTRRRHAMELEGKRTLITGAARGLGLAIARAVRRARRARSCSPTSTATRPSRRAAAIGGDAIGLRCDVTNPSDVQAAIAATVEAFGGLDVLVNNAGIEIGKPIPETDDDEFDQLMARQRQRRLLRHEVRDPGARRDAGHDHQHGVGRRPRRRAAARRATAARRPP